MQYRSFERVFETISLASRIRETPDFDKLKALREKLSMMKEKQSILQKLDRTWTQEPVTLDDAFGRVFPIHLEFIHFLRILHFRAS